LWGEFISGVAIMSRSGYSYDGDNWDHIRWRGMIASATRGKRGQAFFRALMEALDALPEKKLINGSFQEEGCVCALGAVALHKQLPMPSEFDADYDDVDYRALGNVFNIAESLAREVMEENDNGGWRAETPEERWARVRNWAASNIKRETTDGTQEA
jgi:hypothetical protein